MDIRLLGEAAACSCLDPDTHKGMGHCSPVASECHSHNLRSTERLASSMPRWPQEYETLGLPGYDSQNLPFESSCVTDPVHGRQRLMKCKSPATGFHHLSAPLFVRAPCFAAALATADFCGFEGLWGRFF